MEISVIYLTCLPSGYEYSDEDVSDAAPISSDATDGAETASSDDSEDSASLQFMITNRMRRVLEDDLNYHEEEVEMMDPQIASVVIERGLARPLTGMPKSWQRMKPSKPILSGLRKEMSKFLVVITRSANFTIRKVLPVLLPLILTAHALPKLITVLKSNISMKASRRPPVKKSLVRETQTVSSKFEVSKSPAIVSKSPVRKGSGSVAVEVVKLENRIDMKSLNQIVRPNTLKERIFGR